MMHQRGFSTIMLIVIVVSLAWMTRFAVGFIGHSQDSINTRLQYQRVQAAADAAVELERYRLRTLGPAICPPGASNNVTVPLSTGNVAATITCNPSPAGLHTENNPGPITSNSYSFTVVACSPAGAGGVCPNPAMPPPQNYVARQINGSATCPTAPAPIICTFN